ncbi:putative MFS family arabinose efflux permease [Arthrobacter sp. JUb115]|nr:putative MFS family arabinose efflux permease [Arthrobacter sp. JUb115]
MATGTNRLAKNFGTTFVISGATTQGTYFLLAALAVLKTEDPKAVAFQLIAQALPALVLLVLIKKAGDRWNFRTLLIWLLLGQAAVEIIFSIATFILGYQLPAALIASLLLGITTNAQAPGRRSILADLQPEETRRKNMSLLTTYSNIGRLVAPAIASFLMGSNFWPVWFILDAAFCVLSAILVRQALKITGRSAAADSSTEHDSRPRAYSKPVVIFMISFFLLCTFGFNIQVIAPMAGRDLLHDAAAYAGIIVSAHTFGSILGAFVVTRTHEWLRGTYIVGILVLGSSFFLMTPWSAPVPLLIFVAIGGFGRGLALTASSVMTSTWGGNSDFREKLMAFTAVVFTGSNLLSGPIVATTNYFGGAILTLIVCGIGTLLAIIGLAMGKDWEAKSSLPAENESTKEKTE